MASTDYLEPLAASDAEAVIRWLYGTGDMEAENALNWLASIGSGAAQGATTGLVAGPWGALTGGLIGAGFGAVQQAAHQATMPPHPPPTKGPSAQAAPSASRPAPTAPAPTPPHVPQAPAPVASTPSEARIPPDTAALMKQLLSVLPRLVALAQAVHTVPSAASGTKAIDEPENAAIGQLVGQIAPLLTRVQPVLAGLVPALRNAPAQLTAVSPVVRDMLTLATPVVGQLAQVLAPVAGIAAPNPTTAPPLRPGTGLGTPVTALQQLLNFAQLLLQIVGALQAMSAPRLAETGETLAGDRVPDDAYPAEFVPLASTDSAASSVLPVLLPMLLQLLPTLLPLLAQVVPALTSPVRTGSGPLASRIAEAEDDGAAGDAEDWEAHMGHPAPAPPGVQPFLAMPGEWSTEATIIPLESAASGFAWTR